MSVVVLPCCLLLFSQMDSRSSKSIPIVITVIIVMLLSVAGGIVFIKKYVCGGRLVYLSAHVYSPVHNQNPSTGEHDIFFYCPSLYWRCFTVFHSDLTVFWMFPAGSWFTGTRCCSSMLRTTPLMGWTNRWRPTTLKMARLSFMTTQMRYSGYLLLPHTQAGIETWVPGLAINWCHVEIQRTKVVRQQK